MKSASTRAAGLRPVEAPRPDDELMRALAAGELGPLGELYDRYHHDVRQFVRRACSSPDDVDDLVHDTFLTASRAAANYDGRPCARPFLIGIAARLVRARRRLWARWVEVLSAFVSTQDEETDRTPEDHVQATQDAARLDRALARLTEEKRIVLLLFEREGWSGEEVAKALDIPLGTVWTRLFHARAEMRRSLSARDG